jgi:hypothetical protein
VAFEFDDLRATGIRPRQAQRGLIHLRAGYSEAHQLGAWHDLLDAPRQLGLPWMLAGEQLALAEAVGDRADHRLRCVAEDIRPHAQCVVDVCVAVHVVQPRPGTTLEDEWYRLATETEVAVYAAGQHLAGFGVQLA